MNDSRGQRCSNMSKISWAKRARGQNFVGKKSSWAKFRGQNFVGKISWAKFHGQNTTVVYRSPLRQNGMKLFIKNTFGFSGVF